jgi:hypothetical protein
VLDAVGLFVDLLFHEVAILALLDHGGGGRDLDDGALHRPAGRIEEPRSAAVQGNIVALFQIGDLLGEGADRQGV